MLAVFEQSIGKPPSELSTQKKEAKTKEEIAESFKSWKPDSTFYHLSNGNFMAFSHENENPLHPRSIVVMDDIFCIFSGGLDNTFDLRKHYGLSRQATEAMIMVEAYKVLRDRAPYPPDQVIKELEGNFAFILFDSKASTLFLARDRDGSVPLHWGTATDGSLVCSDDSEFIQASCGELYTPFPPGCIFISDTGLISFDHPMHKVKGIAREDDEGNVNAVIFLIACTMVVMPSLSLCFITFILLLGKVQCRVLKLNSLDNSQLLNISYGIDQVSNNQEHGPPLVSSSGKTCEQVYGVFPCANNIAGYIFLIVVCQYLLNTGESLISRGSKTLFNILGTGIFGATVFQILMTLPRIVMVIASGISASKEKAQFLISSGISTTVGATVFNLTLMWGICLICGTKNMTDKPDFQPEESSPFKRLKGLRDTGVTIDKETSYTAGIMLLSLIPFVLVQPVTAFNSFLGRRILIFITLVVSLILLVSYFLYQVLDPWMQERSLEYSKYENLLAGFLHHVQRHARGKLINEEGQPDIDVIKRLFHETDRDADKCLTLAELENLILEMQSGKVVDVDKDYAISKILNSFDKNNDKIIQEEEFVEGCKKWIEEAAQLAQSDDSSSKKILRKAVEKYTQKQRDEIAEIEHIMARLLKHVQTQALEAEHLVKDDGTPNIERIREIFHQYDFDGNNAITKPELEELIGSVKFGEVEINHEDTVKKVLRDFDRNGNEMIDEDEFVHGMTRWLNEAISVTKCPDKKRAIDEYDKIKWSEVDKIVYEVEKDGEINYKFLTWTFNKSVLQVLLGIAIMTLCAKPLVISIEDLSDAMGIPSFLIPFVMVPLALNARMAIAAIFPASQKSSITASLTFSEIYGGVIMNNIMGMTTLLAVVCIKDLRWDYSAEVLIILVVCSVIGLLAFFSTTYPLWTCLLAFSLYPFSVVLFYLLECVFGWA